MEKDSKHWLTEIASALASCHTGYSTEYNAETRDYIIDCIECLKRMTTRMETSRIEYIHAELQTLKSLVADLFSVKTRTDMMSREAIPTYLEKTLMHLKGGRAFKIEN